MKKILVVLLSLVMLLSFLSACGSDDKGKSGGETKPAHNEQTPIDREMKKMAGTITKNAFETSYPEEYWAENAFDDVWANYETNVKSQVAQQYGENITYSFEITSREEQSEETLAKIASKLDILYGIKREDIDAAYKLSYTYKIGGSILQVSDAKEGVTVVSIRGMWYKYPF